MKPNIEALQVFYGSIPVIVTILIAVFSNNKRLDDLGKRIDDLRDSFGKQLASEIGGLREFIRSEIRRLEDRIERI